MWAIADVSVPPQSTTGRRFSETQLLIPALIFLVILFAYPLVKMLGLSFGIPGDPTLASYRLILTQPQYFEIFLVTFQIAGMTAVATLFLAYPLAYYLASHNSVSSRVIMSSLLVPFLVSILVRIFGWTVLLSPGTGLVPRSFQALGVGPLDLIYNRVGVVIGMMYYLLPYMVLSLYSVMRGVDGRIVKASQSLGASDFATFRTVYLPLTMPGVVSGLMLTFVLGVGFFAVPRLMGGPSDQVLSVAIYTQVELAINPAVASALAVVLLLITGLAVWIATRFVDIRSILEGGRQ